MNRLICALVLGILPVQVLSADLVMVEQDGCHWCARWHAEIAHIYPNTAEGQRTPLRVVNLRALPDDIAFATPPVFTPTFVLVEDGQELGRIEGYAGDEFFWFLLGRLQNEHLPPAKPKS